MDLGASFGLSVLAVACSVLAGVSSGAAWYLSRGRRMSDLERQVAGSLQAITERCLQTETTVESQRLTIGGLIDEAAEQFSRVERSRKRAATIQQRGEQAEHQAEQAEPEVAFDQLPRLDQLRVVRARLANGRAS